MAREIHFRRVLPALHTAIAISFGGWGLWLRNSILSRPFWGSNGWNTTAVFHVWPWPLKFAAILNMPAFLGGLVLCWPLSYLRPGLPEWISSLPSLLLVPVLWYAVGSWADKRQFDKAKMRLPGYVGWVLLLLLTLVSVTGALVPLESVGSYTGFL